MTLQINSMRSACVFAICLVLFSVVPVQQVYALSFSAGNIISDAVFTNSSTMSPDAIQSFLNAKNASCVDGTAPCIRNYSEGGKSAATIIYEASRFYTINPQVILVTLQKENGLLTRSRPTPSMYRTAMGYGCPDSTPGVCNSSYYGFYNQVNWAAKLFRGLMNGTAWTSFTLGNNYIGYEPNPACGGTNVYIQNRATLALYTYTPYQPNAAALAAGYGTGDGCSAYGNRNFWLYFNDWFGSTSSTVLLQSPSSQAVYLQNGNERYGIPTWDIINAYGLGSTPVTAVSDSYMSSLVDRGSLSTTFTSKATPGPVYLADNGYRFGFATYQQCVDWGFPRCLDSTYSRALEPSIFDRMLTFGALRPLMLHGSSISVLSNGEKRTFLSAQAVRESGFSDSDITPITNSSNASQPEGYMIPPEHSFIGIRNSPYIYAYAGGKYYILSYDAYKGMDSSSTPLYIDTFSKYTSTPPQSTATVGPYIQLGDGRSYALTSDKKYDISSVSSDWPAAQQLDAMRQILDRRPADKVVSSTTSYRTDAGVIYRIEKGTWRMYYSLYDFFADGNTTTTATSNRVLSDLPVGDPLFAAGKGSLYQLSDSNQRGTIYNVNLDNTTCQISNMDQLGQYGYNTLNVARIPKLNSQSIHALTNTTYDETGALHVINSGSHAIVSSTSLRDTWGIQSKFPSCTLHSAFLNKSPGKATTLKFARSKATGVIYLGDSGKKRPIYSYDAFIKLGGTGSNTIDVSNEFLAASPDGAPIYN